jgi:hypothetical protein
MLRCCTITKYTLHLHHIKRTAFNENKFGPVVQLVRMPPCHGGGRGFESRPDRRFSAVNASRVKDTCFQIIGPVVQLVRMPPCHGGGRGFESRPDRNKA